MTFQYAVGGCSGRNHDQGDKASCSSELWRWRPSFHAGSRRGTAVVEAALVTMGFLVLVFGIMEVGRFMSVQQTITDAAREGARLAVAPASQTSTLPVDAQVEDRISYFLEANGIPVGGGSGATISIDRNVTIGGDLDRYTRATVTYPYPPFSLSMFSSLEITMRGISRMRNETSP